MQKKFLTVFFLKFRMFPCMTHGSVKEGEGKSGRNLKRERFFVPASVTFEESGVLVSNKPLPERRSVSKKKNEEVGFSRT